MIGVYRYLKAREGQERELDDTKDSKKRQKEMESTLRKEATVKAIEALVEKEKKLDTKEEVEVIHIASQDKNLLILWNSYHRSSSIQGVLLYHAL